MALPTLTRTAGAVHQRRFLRLTPITWIVVATTVIGAVLRLARFVSPSARSGLVGYDDGVYFGAAVRLVHGSLPYRDFVLVHPPLIAVLMSPFALLASSIGAAKAFALARIFTALVGVAAVPLVGLVLRHRGAFPVMIGCSIIAVLTGAVQSARTVLLEPYLVLFCLVAVLLIFDRDRLASPRRLVLGGLVLGLGVGVKLWAVAPLAVVLAVCLIRRRGLRRVLVGSAIGAAAAIVPFALAAPRAFVHDVLIAQFLRTGAPTPKHQRIVDLLGLTGLNPISAHMGIRAEWIALIVVPTLVIVFYRRVRRGPTALEMFGFGSLVVVTVMFSVSNQFYWHYAGYEAVFAALAVGLAGTGIRMASRRAVAAGVLAAVLAVPLVVSAGVEARRISSTPAPVAAIRKAIPPGVCVVGNDSELLLAADRFSVGRRCPAMLDAFGIGLALADGHPGGHAASYAPFLAAWRHAVNKADYLLISTKFLTLIPWHAGLRTLVKADFVRIPTPTSSVLLFRRKA